GDIRGGISITLPMDVPVFNWKMLISHLLAMVAGVGCILFFGARLIESRNKLIGAYTNLENEVHERKQAQEELLEARDKLEERVQERTAELNQEVKQRTRAEKALQLSENAFRLALDSASDGVWDRNLRTGKVYSGENLAKMFGYTAEEVKSHKIKWESLLHPDDKLSALAAVKNHLKGNTSRYISEYRIRNKSGDWQWVLSRGKIVEWDAEDRPLRFIGTYTDITYLKNIEQHLQDAQAELEQKIKERTIELEETNIALKVLLAKRGESKKNLEKQILSNVGDLIEPYLIKLKKISSTNEQQVLIGILESNINEITSSFSSDFAINFVRLTPAEIQVANLIKQGKRTKDIAELMNLSPGTISIHRKNIRKKLDLTNQGVNLQSFLSSYSH
ncbi:MAG: PAS domain-containing protein, partial [Desulfobulbaceae bacterium]|nr:PAS domain-containing protein [Desulfobulbaceae bacterium]